MEGVPGTKYISYHKSDKRFSVQKSINGKVKSLGGYKTLIGALMIRDYCIANNWKPYPKHKPETEKYISYRKGNGEARTIWGHQHSSLVSIRATNNPQGEIIQFNDLSDFGRGVADSFMAQSVASVSFSNDNNRIMMVGNDGVVIIRNLYLNSYASE